MEAQGALGASSLGFEKHVFKTLSSFPTLDMHHVCVSSTVSSPFSYTVVFLLSSFPSRTFYLKRLSLKQGITIPSLLEWMNNRVVMRKSISATTGSGIGSTGTKATLQLSSRVSCVTHSCLFDESNSGTRIQIRPGACARCSPERDHWAPVQQLSSV